jgi:D-alanyl-lipoteichoic acid acyltransferase DltB (MBOAT superfamily)
MLFNSLEFIAFFLIVTCLYFLVSHKYRWVLLLVANYYFYMSWKPEFLVLIMLSTVVDFYCSKQIAKTQLATRKKIYLMVSLGINLGILCFFKYANFITGSLADFLDLISIDINLPYSHIILPVGISFYTFQTISYTIDVYKWKIQPEKHLGIFATYISFFPQLVAWPIERAAHLLPQFREHHLFTWDIMISW